MNVEVVDDAWASLLPDLLLDILCRLQTTAVIRCACVCKPWRRLIISNASVLRVCPDRFNPNLLLGFFHEEVATDSWPARRVIVSVAAGDDTMHSDMRLSSLIPAVDQSPTHWILSSRDGFLLLRFHHGSNQDELLLPHELNHDELCLCNPMAQDCTILPLSSILEEKDCQYTIVTSHVGHGAVRILAVAGMVTSSADRLTYQVFSCDGEGAGIWGQVQCSNEVNNGVPMRTYGRNTVVGSNSVHWLTGPHMSGCRICTVGLNINTGRAWTTDLPRQCQFFHTSTTLYFLTTSVNGRLSLLQPLPDQHIKVWVLDGDGDAMEWTVQHKISLDVQNYHLRHHILGSHYLNAICPRSGSLLIVLFSGMHLRINLDSHARQPVQRIGKRGRNWYYPYEMDWSTYITNMKSF